MRTQEARNDGIDAMWNDRSVSFSYSVFYPLSHYLLDCCIGPLISSSFLADRFACCTKEIEIVIGRLCEQLQKGKQQDRQDWERKRGEERTGMDQTNKKRKEGRRKKETEEGREGRKKKKKKEACNWTPVWATSKGKAAEKEQREKPIKCEKGGRKWKRQEGDPDRSWTLLKTTGLSKTDRQTDRQTDRRKVR